jgi:hypothetical protein
MSDGALYALIGICLYGLPALAIVATVAIEALSPKEDTVTVTPDPVAAEERAAVVPADRAAVLREAADELEADYPPESGYDRGRAWCVEELRRLAGEARDERETQAEAQAQPPRYRWCVETLDPLAAEWAPGTRFLNRAHAVERYQAVSESHPAWNDGGLVQRRLVRETVTYTVEPAAALPEAAEGAQQ